MIFSCLRLAKDIKNQDVIVITVKGVLYYGRVHNYNRDKTDVTFDVYFFIDKKEYRLGYKFFYTDYIPVA